MTGARKPPRKPGPGPTEEPALARFLRDWTALWREELRAQGTDPDGMPAEMTAAMESWREAMAGWASGFAAAGGGGERAATPRTEAADAAPDARDAEIERLARRVDELEARLAKLETPRQSGRRPTGGPIGRDRG